MMMSERIKELAERATIYIEPTPTSGEGWIFDKEKFAELIVAECIDAAVEAQADFYIVHNIKSRFGVEE
jgi:hypothetical protein